MKKDMCQRASDSSSPERVRQGTMQKATKATRSNRTGAAGKRRKPDWAGQKRKQDTDGNAARRHEGPQGRGPRSTGKDARGRKKRRKCRGKEKRGGIPLQSAESSHMPALKQDKGRAVVRAAGRCGLARTTARQKKE